MNEQQLILIAEDHPVSAGTLAKACKSLGHIPIISSDGERALHVMEDNPDIPLLITDMQMPNLSGEELINALRSQERFKKLPIIIVSGIVSVKDIKHILDVGASYFLQKPAPLNELKTYIKNCIGEAL